MQSRRRGFLRIRLGHGRRQTHPEQYRRQFPAKTPLSEEMSEALKKRGFKFVGPVIVYAWMQATGIVNDHATDCFRRNAR